MKMYKYTILKQDGSSKVLPICRKKEFKGKDGLYELLNCSIIEIIPEDYYKGLEYGRCTMYGDEEARFNTNNMRNPHFSVLKDFENAEWDVVGDIIKEEVYKS